MSALPKYFPDNLDLPLPTSHKTWHTERLCPPLLAYALGTDQALFIAQLHHWLQYEDFGIYKHGWHWIWNTEWEWQEQFPWWSEDKTGHIRRSLEREGYVVSNNFSRTPLNRTKYSTLDYYKIALETGWNPLVLDLSRDYPQPPQFVKGQRQRGRHISDQVELVYSDTSETPEPSLTDDSAKIQNGARQDTRLHSGTNPQSSIYKKNSLSTKKRSGQIERESDLCESLIPEGNQDEDGSDPWLEGDNDSQVVTEPPLSHSSKPESKGRDKYSAPVADKFVKSEQTNKREQTKPVKPVEMDREPYEWEIAKNRPFDVFLRWWADRKYVPQGGKWEADALGNAYSEFYNNPNKVTAVIFPQFLEFMQQVASNGNQARFAGLKVTLPSCFKVLPIPTKENVQQLMANIQVLIDDGASVSVRQGIATPSCQQSISYEEALINTIKPLADLKPPELPPTTDPPLAQTETLSPSLSSVLSRKQAAWRNLPHLRNSIIAWVEQTDGVVLGENGPELEPAAVGEGAEEDAKACQYAAQCRDTSAEKTLDLTARLNTAPPDQTLGQTAQSLDAQTAPTEPQLSAEDPQTAAMAADDEATTTSPPLELLPEVKGESLGFGDAETSAPEVLRVAPDAIIADAMQPTAESELEGYYEQYLEPPSPEDFTPPEGKEPDLEKQMLIRERIGETDHELVAPTTNPEPDPKLTQDFGSSLGETTPPPPLVGAAAYQPAPVFKVGDRVVWVNAPAHWSSWGALTITDIQSGLVLVDCSQKRIPMSELRHVDDDEGVNSG